MNVLGVAGSLRRGSFNRQLLDDAAAGAPAEVAVRVCDGLAAIPLFVEDFEEASAERPVADLCRTVKPPMACCRGDDGAQAALRTFAGR